MGAVVATAAILAAWSAKWVIDRISVLAFKRIGYSAMVLSGLGMLSSATATIASHNRADIDCLPIDNGYEAKLKWANKGLASFPGPVRFRRRSRGNHAGLVCWRAKT